MKKKGQFYLMASIIIVGILIALISIQNSSFKKEDLKLEHFSDELKIEGVKVIDFDKNTGNSEFENFAKNYSNYLGDDINVYFIIGQTNSIEVYSFEKGVKTSKDYNQSGSKLDVEIDSKLYEFNLKKGNNFHFIMVEKTNNEQHVIVY